jgi:short-subunit dehydrogenase
MKELKPLTLLVGVSGDLLEVAKMLGRRGERIALMSRNEQNMRLYQDRLAGLGIPARYFVADVTESDQVLQAFQALSKSSERLDRLIYNVGVVSNESASSVTGPEMSRVMSANFFGFVNCLQLALPMFKRLGHGHAITISSSRAMNPEASPVAFAASKSSLQIYIRALREELRGKDVAFSELFLGVMQGSAGVRYLTAEEIVEGILHVIEHKPERHLIGMCNENLE